MKFVVCVIVFAACSIVLAHSIHISYCNATATPTEFSGKASYYKDDFFLALKNWKGGNVNGLTDDDWNKLKYDYLSEKLRAISDNTAPLKLTIESSGEDVSEIWFQFRFTTQTSMHSLNVSQSILFREYSDQSNIMMIQTATKQYNHVFVPSDSTFTIIF